MSTMQIALFDFIPLNPAPPAARIIRRCQRKGCNHTWARDYEPESMTRLTEAGTRISSSHITEWRCPKCEGSRVEGSQVRGQHSSHVCDARCMCATGPLCECSCGGKNHGKMWLDNEPEGLEND